MNSLAKQFGSIRFVRAPKDLLVAIGSLYDLALMFLLVTIGLDHSTAQPPGSVKTTTGRVFSHTCNFRAIWHEVFNLDFLSRWVNGAVDLFDPKAVELLTMLVISDEAPLPGPLELANT